MMWPMQLVCSLTQLARGTRKMLLLQRYDCEHKNNCIGEWEQANQVIFLVGNVALSLCTKHGVAT